MVNTYNKDFLELKDKILIYLKENNFKKVNFDNMYYIHYKLRDKSYEQNLKCKLYLIIDDDNIYYYTQTEEYGNTEVTPIFNFETFKNIVYKLKNYNNINGFNAKIKKILS